MSKDIATVYVENELNTDDIEEIRSIASIFKDTIILEK